MSSDTAARRIPNGGGAELEPGSFGQMLKFDKRQNFRRHDGV